MSNEDAVDAEVVDSPTEITAIAVRDHTTAIDPYEGVATLALTDEQGKKLAQVLPDDEHDILPTGELYVSQVRYRRILNDTFGPGAWALVPRSKFFQEERTICREYALFVNGKFVAEAIGEQDYHQNSRMSYATAAESVKSNALMRCCKDLGIASECWDRHWTEDWKRKYAICVKVIEKDRGQDKEVWRWRRKDARKLPREIGNAPSGDGPPPPAQSAPSPGVRMPQAKKQADEPRAAGLDMHEAIRSAERAAGSPPQPGETFTVMDDVSQGDIERALQQSLVVINTAQRKKLFATLGDSAHNEEQFRDWLQNVAGLTSTKEIPSAGLDAILRRLEDPTPLAQDYA